jgi:rhamnose utilization protein RhaD (predicted bifunctional aldolase and dehydrogenase)
MRRKNPPRREATPEEKESIEVSLEWLERHVVEDDNGCWVWQGYITKSGQPHARMTVAPNVYATMLVRRLVVKARMGGGDAVIGHNIAVNNFLRKRQCNVKDECSRGCCHPDHIVVRSKKQAMANTKGKPISEQHRQNISRARRKNSRIDDATILKMMLDPRPGKHVALELGVHPSYVPHVRTGKLRAYSATGGIFSGLLAANHGAFHAIEAESEAA